MTYYLLAVLQVVVALGLLNVWLIRNGKPTDYRGKDAKNLKQEFLAYGLPEIAYYIVGALKILSAVLLLAGFYIPRLIPVGAGVVTFLMLGALMMHMKVSDPLKKSLPALSVLIMSSIILFSTSSYL